MVAYCNCNIGDSSVHVVRPCTIHSHIIVNTKATAYWTFEFQCTKYGRGAIYTVSKNIDQK